MTTAAAAFTQSRPRLEARVHTSAARRRSAAHLLALAFVWLAVAASGLVFFEPAPVDALFLGLIILLPAIGLVRLTPVIVLYLSAWLIVAAGGYIACATVADMHGPVVFTSVSLYLSLASAVFAGFVAKRPEAHTRLILSAWTFAGVIAAAAAVTGYFSALPGAYDLFTKYGRAAGTFKDPNVLGPFLVTPALYMLHLVVSQPLRRILLPLAVAGLMALAVLLSFSRGAWVNLAVAVLVYGYLAFVTATSNRQRLRVLLLGSAGVAMLLGLVAVAAQMDGVSDLMRQRATLEQSYDSGPDGRFGGQAKALGLIAGKPLGIGALTFGAEYHHEEVHNVYLSMMLNAGWLGGGMYWLIVAVTVAFGFRHVLRASETRPLFLIVYAAILATVLEGAIIDTDHWRHFYLLAGMAWGLMAAGKAHVAEAIVRRGGRRSAARH